MILSLFLSEGVMSNKVDDTFYSRADAHINLSNDQLRIVEGRGKVSSSTLYAAARFNAWVSACGFDSGKQMAAARAETINYFCEQYRLMLEENLDDYIENFEKFMVPKE
jgi:hypothetical protein